MTTTPLQKAGPSTECPCGCGVMLAGYAERRPRVCLKVWFQVPSKAKAIIMSHAWPEDQRKEVIAWVYDLAAKIRAEREAAGKPRKSRRVGNPTTAK